MAGRSATRVGPRRGSPSNEAVMALGFCALALATFLGIARGPLAALAEETKIGSLKTVNISVGGGPVRWTVGGPPDDANLDASADELAAGPEIPSGFDQLDLDPRLTGETFLAGGDWVRRVPATEDGEADSDGPRCPWARPW